MAPKAIRILMCCSFADVWRLQAPSAFATTRCIAGLSMSVLWRVAQFRHSISDGFGRHARFGDLFRCDYEQAGHRLYLRRLVSQPLLAVAAASRVVSRAAPLREPIARYSSLDFRDERSTRCR